MAGGTSSGDRKMEETWDLVVLLLVVASRSRFGLTEFSSLRMAREVEAKKLAAPSEKTIRAKSKILLFAFIVKRDRAATGLDIGKSP